MVRKLRFHEEKLLKKVNFTKYKKDETSINTILHRYKISKDEYYKYNKIVGLLSKIVTKLSKLDQLDPFRVLKTNLLLSKLNTLSLNINSLQDCLSVNTSSLIRRRLSVIMISLKMAPTIKDSTDFIQKGNVRVGVEVVDDPAFLVTAKSQDLITWTDSSSIKRRVLEYNDELDDYDLL